MWTGRDKNGRMSRERGTEGDGLAPRQAATTRQTTGVRRGSSSRAEKEAGEENQHCFRSRVGAFYNLSCLQPSCCKAALTVPAL